MTLSRGHFSYKLQNNLGKIMEVKFRIESSIGELLPATLKEILELGRASISGQPLHYIPLSTDVDPMCFDSCEALVDEPVSIGRVYEQKINLAGHRHLGDRFISEDGYPVVQCFTFTGDEVLMGIRESLGFQIRNLEGSEAFRRKERHMRTSTRARHCLA
jgi:hypothetical protein